MLVFMEKFFFAFTILFGSVISSDPASSFSNLAADDECTQISISTDDDSKSQTYKYVMKSYFDKYGSLDDTEFQNFIMFGLPFTSCEVILNKTFTPSLNIEEMYLSGMGSHRKLFLSIKADGHSKVYHLLPQHSCQLLFIERLPLGIFADEFELQHLFHLGVFQGVLVTGDTNIEFPTVNSGRSVLEIQMNLGPNFLGVPGGRKIDIALPLHARYPPLDESGYVRVEVGAPDMLLCCSIQMNFSNQSCCLQPLVSNYGGNEKVGWRVPCGKRPHSSVVYYITFFTSFASAIIVTTTAIFYTHSKNMKQA